MGGSGNESCNTDAQARLCNNGLPVAACNATGGATDKTGSAAGADADPGSVTGASKPAGAVPFSTDNPVEQNAGAGSPVEKDIDSNVTAAGNDIDPRFAGNAVVLVDEAEAASLACSMGSAGGMDKDPDKRNGIAGGADTEPADGMSTLDGNSRVLAGEVEDMSPLCSSTGAADESQAVAGSAAGAVTEPEGLSGLVMAGWEANGTALLGEAEAAAVTNGRNGVDRDAAPGSATGADTEDDTVNNAAPPASCACCSWLLWSASSTSGGSESWTPARRSSRASGCGGDATTPGDCSCPAAGARGCCTASINALAEPRS